MNKKIITLLVALALLFIGATISVKIDTDFGAMTSQRLYLVDDDGYTVTANLFIPDNATAANPAPAMIICPGGDSPSDISMPWATEIARRGYVVALMDYTGCGDTAVNPNAQYWTNNGAMELDTVYDYLAELAFVDPEQIGVGGHSMGSLYSYRLSTKRDVSLVVSDVLYNDPMPTYDFDFVQISASHDEGLLARLAKFEDIYSDPFLCGVFGVDRIEPGKLYGSWEEGNARIFYEINQTHQDDMVSGQFIRLLVRSVMDSMEAPKPLPEDNLVYGWKILGLAIAFAGIATLLFAVAAILLDSDLFSSLKLPAPKQVPGFELGSRAWWISALILTLIPVAAFFPGTGVGNKMASTSLFQLGTTPNGYLIWTLFAAVGMLAFFVIYHALYGKKQGGTIDSYGFGTGTAGLMHIVKSAVFSLVLFLLGYFVILLLYRYANTDLHLWTASFRPLSHARCETLPWYFLGLLPYFALVMLAGNAVKSTEVGKDGKGMVKSVLLSMVIALVGMIILCVFHQVYLRLYRPFTTINFAHFYLDLLMNLLPQFAVASSLAIYIRKKTNSFYPGILIGAAMLAYGMVSTNCLSMIIS